MKPTLVLDGEFLWPLEIGNILALEVAEPNYSKEDILGLQSE